MNPITKKLNQSPLLFIVWTVLASFGTYFCMYAFRKPLSTGIYTSYTLFGIGYKTCIIISQVLGYMLSKFIGIKVISELRPNVRIRLIMTLILVSHAALLLFALTPYPYNFPIAFLNGLPLGMVWGVVFSFLEGRRYTEMLSIGLSISIIAASGVLKTIYLVVQDWLPFVSEFWMPFVMGLIFLPLFCLFVGMLAVIPAPGEADKVLRSERVPMTRTDKKLVYRKYGWGLLSIVLMYIMLSTLRDFRDNFSREIWTEIDPHWQKGVLAQTEVLSMIVVLVCIALLSFIRSNLQGFWASIALVFAGVCLTGGSTWMFEIKMIGAFNWMFLSGTGLFLAYVPIQVALFERMIALFRIKANAGFFVYICDATGYAGSVGILVYKEFFAKTISWTQMTIHFCYLLFGLSTVLLLFTVAFFRKRYYRHKSYVADYTPAAQF